MGELLTAIQIQQMNIILSEYVILVGNESLRETVETTAEMYAEKTIVFYPMNAVRNHLILVNENHVKYHILVNMGYIEKCEAYESSISPIEPFKHFNYSNYIRDRIVDKEMGKEK